MQHDVRLPSFFISLVSLLIAFECRWKSNKNTRWLTHTLTNCATDLPEGALAQDLAQFELLGVGLLRALFNVMRDGDLLHRHVILRNSSEFK